jgi:HSP20 family protein
MTLLPHGNFVVGATHPRFIHWHETCVALRRARADPRFDPRIARGKKERKTMTTITRGNDGKGVSARTKPFRAMNEIIHYDPFRAMRQLMGATLPGGGMTPAFEVKETSDAYVIEADLPGVKDEDVEVDLTGHRLTISGKREDEREDESHHFYTYERSYGTFARAFSLPETADVDRTEANLADGVLHVTVPKKEPSQARKVPLGQRIKQAVRR